MNKKGGALKIFALIFLILILLVLLTALYFYQFHVFKEFRTCVSNQEEDTNFSCISNEQCIELAMNYSNIGLEEMPELMQEEIMEVFNEAIYCNNTCRIKEIYGEFAGEPVQACNEGDKEFLLQLRGKDLLKMMDYIDKIR